MPTLSKVQVVSYWPPFGLTGCNSHTAALEAPPPSPVAHTASVFRCRANDRPGRHRRRDKSAIRFLNVMCSADDRHRCSTAPVGSDMSSWTGEDGVPSHSRCHASPCKTASAGFRGGDGIAYCRVGSKCTKMA